MKTIHHILCCTMMATMFIACSDNKTASINNQLEINELKEEINSLKNELNELKNKTTDMPELSDVDATPRKQSNKGVNSVMVDEAAIIDYILHLDYKSRKTFITGKKNARAKGKINDEFEKLPQNTKNAFVQLFKHPAYHIVNIPKEITTIDEAIKYLNDYVND